MYRSTIPNTEIIARIFAIVTEDQETSRAYARCLAIAYLNVPVCAQFHRWLGRAAILEPKCRAWAVEDRAGALAAVPEALLDELFLAGTPAGIRAGVEAYRAVNIMPQVLAIMRHDRARAALHRHTTDSSA